MPSRANKIQVAASSREYQTASFLLFVLPELFTICSQIYCNSLLTQSKRYGIIMLYRKESYESQPGSTTVRLSNLLYRIIVRANFERKSED